MKNCLGDTHYASNIHSRWFDETSTRGAHTPCTSPRAHHVHRHVHPMYMSARDVVHRHHLTTRESLEVVFQKKLTLHNENWQAGYVTRNNDLTRR